MLLFQSSIFWAIERVMSRSHAGIITFANGSRTLECTIHNSSASWAELRAEGAAIVPHRLELQEGPSAPRRATVTAGFLFVASASRRAVPSFRALPTALLVNNAVPNQPQ